MWQKATNTISKEEEIVGRQIFRGQTGQLDRAATGIDPRVRSPWPDIQVRKIQVRDVQPDAVPANRKILVQQDARI